MITVGGFFFRFDVSVVYDVFAVEHFVQSIHSTSSVIATFFIENIFCENCSI